MKDASCFATAVNIALCFGGLLWCVDYSKATGPTFNYPGLAGMFIAIGLLVAVVAIGESDN